MFQNDEWNHLYRYCFSLTKQEDSAYDLLHNAVEKFLAKPPANVNCKKAYLRQIARNQFIDQYRFKKRYPEESLSDNEPINLTTEPLEKVMIDQQTLNIVWQELNHEESELMFLWSVEGLTAQAIADELEKPRGTVLSRIHRIRQKLNKALKQRSYKEA